MIGDSLKIFIGRQEGESVLAACCRNHKIDRAGIDAL
jgi:hypothetical protein